MAHRFWPSAAIPYVVVSVVLMGAFLPLARSISGADVDLVEGDPLQRSMLLAGYALSLLRILYRPGRILSLATRAPILWALLMWVLLSPLWSDYPEASLRKALGLVLATLYALTLYSRFSPLQQLRILGWSLSAAIALSLATVFLLPDWGVMGYPHEGAWRGVFIHKNSLGRYAALGLLLFFTLASFSRRWSQRLLWGVSFVLSFVALVGSRSIASWVVAAVVAGSGLVLYLGYRFQWSFPVFLVFLVSTIVGAGLIAVYVFEPLLEFLGRDATLTGRIPLWITLAQYARERSWLGYGFGTFWLGSEGPSGTIWRMVGWQPSHAHNGFIDLWLELGWIGVFLGVALLAVNAGRHLFRGSRGEILSIFWALFAVYLVVINLVESNLVRQNSLFWVLLTLGCLHGGRSMRAGRIPTQQVYRPSDHRAEPRLP